MTVCRCFSFFGWLFLLCSAIAPVTPAQQRFRIAGVVVDSVSGTPIDRAEVTLAPVANLQTTTTTLSASNGAFVFAGLAPGKYRLTAGRAGFTNQGLDQHEGFMTAVAVGPKLDSEHIRFRLFRESVISGVVSDEFGEPLRDAELFLFERRLASGLRTPQLAARTITNDIGEYRFPHLAPGTYMVVVHAKPWYGNNSQQLNVIRMGSTTIRDGHELNRSQIVADSDENVDSDDSTANSTVPANNLSAVPPDPRRDVVYPLSFYSNADSLDSATPLILSSGSTLTADFFLHPVPALKLLVKLPDSPSEQLQEGTDRSTAGVMQIARGMTASFELAGQQLEYFPAQRSQQFPGYFEIAGVTPGEVVLHPINQSRQGIGGGIVVKQVSSDGTIDLSASNPATVSGVVNGIQVGPSIDLARNTASNAAALVFVSPDGKTTYNAALNQKGEFTLVIPAGNYTIALQPNPFFHVASVRATGATLSGHTVSIPSSANVKLTVHGAQANCTVTGTALKNGKPFAGAMLILVPEDPTQNPSLFHRDQSDSDGSFTMSPVLPGRYTLLALENGWDLEWSSLSVLFPYLPAGVPLDLRPASSISATVKVQ